MASALTANYPPISCRSGSSCNRWKYLHNANGWKSACRPWSWAAHSEADIRVAYPDVSRRHCRLAFQDGYWHIVDLNSLNGLFVNGERIHEAVLLEGDLIRLGSVIMEVQSRTQRPRTRSRACCAALPTI